MPCRKARRRSPEHPAKAVSGRGGEKDPLREQLPILWPPARPVRDARGASSDALVRRDGRAGGTFEPGVGGGCENGISAVVKWLSLHMRR